MSFFSKLISPVATVGAALIPGVGPFVAPLVGAATAGIGQGSARTHYSDADIAAAINQVSAAVENGQLPATDATWQQYTDLVRKPGGMAQTLAASNQLYALTHPADAHAAQAAGLPPLAAGGSSGPASGGGSNLLPFVLVGLGVWLVARR